MAASLNDAEVGVCLCDLVRYADARLVVAGDAKTANIVERVDRPLGAGDGHADAEVCSVYDFAAFVGASGEQRTNCENGEKWPERKQTERCLLDIRQRCVAVDFVLNIHG